MQFSNQEKCHACINDTGGFTICYGLRGGLDVFTQVCAFVREDKYLDRVVKQLSRKIPANKIRQIKKALDGRDGH
ncbi:MAG: hypothetical protein FWC61_04345 [Proteobacteria bacterium]|nr:hypothetical protein [Pseudomonadota bacterium]